MKLATRLARVKPSLSLAAAALAAQGRDIISLTTGESDFDTPQHTKDAALRAIEQGMTKYTAVEGTATLRQAICAKFRRENALRYAPDQVIVGVGVKQVIYNAPMATIARSGSASVEGDLMHNSRLSTGRLTEKSVNVPPTSTPMNTVIIYALTFNNYSSSI